MESQSFHNESLVSHALSQMIDACDMIVEWNKNTKSVDDFVSSSDGMQKLAASCMLIESIGEGVKKIDKLLPDFLNENAPDVPWRSIKGMRDHIAHGYFNIDAEFVYDVAINEIPGLRSVFESLKKVLE